MKRKSHTSYFFTSIVIAITLSGCKLETRTFPTVEILEGSFTTPSGVHEVYVLNKYKDEPSHDGAKINYDSVRIHSRSDQVGITVNAIRTTQADIISHSNQFQKNLVLTSMSYSFDNNHYYNLMSGVGNSRYSERAYSEPGYEYPMHLYIFSLNLPKPLTETSIGGIRRKSSIFNRFKKYDEKIHHLKLGFLLDGENYILDVKFQLFVNEEKTLPTPMGGLSP